MNKSFSPIGVFDSGYGGLTVLNSIRKELPEYDFLYLGDNARAPYGTRSFDVVYEYTLQCVLELFERNCDLVILACNTASAKALRTIQQGELKNHPNKRVLGVIRPSTEIVGQFSKNKTIGIMATEGTVKSQSYRIEIQKFHPEVTVVQQACPLWVPLIENKAYNSKEGKKFIEKDIQRFLSQYPSVDVIVLACTHYPLLLPYLKEIIPKNIKLISQGEIVAPSLKDYLKRHDWLNKKISKNGQVTYLTTESSDLFNESVEYIFGQHVNAKNIHLK